ncbi:hypothetical protein [Amycolatopsis sp. NPDC049159]|uniref:hypothetical protein n=1 Tax=Amycolatopsis sp. NPDC049159 TaxID=3157210 RepID=UPI0033CB36D4
MDEEHYTRIEEIRERLNAAEREAGGIREELYGAIRAAIPELNGGEPKRGVVSEIARRSGFTREYVAMIRDGKYGAKESDRG